MGKSPESNNKENTSKSINVYATTADKIGLNVSPLQYFAESIDNPPYIKRTRAHDRAVAKATLLGIDTDEIVNEEIKKRTEINNTIKITQGKQIAYILTEIGKRLDKNETEINGILEKHAGEYVRNEYKDKWTTQGFISTLNSLKKDGTTVLSDAEINQIVLDSALEENIGLSENEYSYLSEDYEEKIADNKRDVIYNHTNQRGAETADYNERLTKIVLDQTGYERAKLISAFDDCFSEPYDKVECDYKLLNEIRQKIIAEKMNSLPEDQRTEKAFIEECEKLDVAINAFVFPNFDCTPDIKQAFLGASKDEYYQFASNNISPIAAARDTETEFNDYLEIDYRLEETNEAGLNNAAAYIKHLEDIHKKRPFMTRFFDYFKRDGEDSTIKRMKNALSQRGFTKQEIEEAIQNTPSKLNDVNNIDQRYEDLSNNKLRLPRNVSKGIKEFDKKYDEAIKKIDTKLTKTPETTKEVFNDPETEKTKEELKTLKITVVKTTETETSNEIKPETSVEENANTVSEEERAALNQQMKNDIVASLNDRKPKEEIVTEKVTEAKVAVKETEIINSSNH